MSQNNYWIGLGRDPAYSIAKLIYPIVGMKALREMFPDGEANDLNFVLFSTSGTHGDYLTIENCEREFELVECDDDSEDETIPEPDRTELTFLIVQPRLVTLRYGICTPRSLDDLAFLKRLRASSWAAVQKIGAP